MWDRERRWRAEKRQRSPGTVRRRGQKRVKRYDRNAYRNWKPGDPDPWADTQADHERKYNADIASRRREKEAKRRHNEERARLNAFLFHFVPF